MASFALLVIAAIQNGRLWSRLAEFDPKLPLVAVRFWLVVVILERLLSAKSGRLKVAPIGP